MPEFTLHGVVPTPPDEAECIILDGTAHIFGADEVTDQVMRQAVVFDVVTLLRDWDWRAPIGTAAIMRTDEEIHVRARVHELDAPSLAGCPYFALAVKIVGQEGEASTMDYVTVYAPPSVPADSPTKPLVPPYRLTQVPEQAVGELVDYVHVEHGTEERRHEWWHRDDPILDAIFP